MASSYTDLGIEKMATGENAGTWGTKTNTNLDIIEKSIAGYVEQAVTSGSTTTLAITDGDATESTSVARHAVIKLTGTISANSIVTVPDSVEKVYIVTNGTSGAYTVQFKTVSGTGITFGTTEKTTRLVYSDGTNLVDAGFGGASDMEGRELVLDADGDTTITADTDDQIDIKIAGADDFQFTANTFTAQAGSTIVAPTITASTAFVPDASDGAALGTSALEFSDLFLADGAVINFGDDQEIKLTHVADTGLTLKHTATADDKPISLTLQTGETDIAANDVIGKIDFQAPDEGTGTDAILVAAGIEAVSEGDFSSSSNATKLSFKTGVSEAAAEKMSLSSGGNLTISGDLTVSGDDITMGTNTAGHLLIADGTNFNSVAATSLSAISTVASDDVLLAVDTSGGGLKKITRSTLVAGLATTGAISNIVEDTSPQLGANLDTNSHNILIDDAHFIGDENGNEQIIFQTTGSAVNQFDVTNSATGDPPSIKATGGDSNIDFNISAKGTGHVTVLGDTNSGAIQFNCESNSHGQIVIAQPHSAAVTNTLTLPAGSSSTLVSLVSTDTLTNKTLTTPVIAEIDSGSTITLDATTDIVLDADGGDVFFKDAGTTFGSATNTSGNLIIKSGTTTAATFSGANVTLAGTVASGAITSSGIVKTDDTTDATSTTDGSLQTDGGLSVAKDTIIGNDLKLLSDSSVLVFGAGSDATLTHTNDTGLTLNSTNKLMFNDASQFIQGSSATVLSIGATDEIDLTATAVDLNGTLNVSGVATFQAAPVFPDGSIAVADLDIDGATDIGAAIVDADLFIIDDGAGGTNRKVTASRLKTYAGGGGKILQVVNSDNEYDTTISATSYGDVLSSSGTTWETAITPSASDSKILVLASISLQTAGTSGAAEGRGKIQMLAKTGAGSYSSVNELIYAGAYDYGGNGIVFGWHHPVNLLHSPSTTSAVTFKFQTAIYSGADSIVTNNLGFSRIQLIEVGA